MPSPFPSGRTFEAEVGAELQEDFHGGDEPQLGDLQQGIAHAFLVEGGVGLPLQNSPHSRELAPVAAQAGRAGDAQRERRSLT